MKELNLNEELLKRAQVGYKKAQSQSNHSLMFAHSQVALKATAEIKRLKSLGLASPATD